MTIQSLIDAIAEALFQEFGSDYTIYTEKVEQNLEEDCFLIRCLNPTKNQHLGRCYKRTNQFSVQYIPSTIRDIEVSDDLEFEDDMEVSWGVETDDNIEVSDDIETGDNIKTGDANEKCASVLERLFECLEDVILHGKPIHGKDLHGEITNGILTFTVNYDGFVLKAHTEETGMGNVEISTEVKG